MSVLIETKLDDPIVDRTGPFAIRQKGFGVCSQRTEQNRNVWVTPTDQNHFSLLARTQVSRQVSRLTVAKTCACAVTASVEPKKAAMKRHLFIQVTVQTLTAIKQAYTTSTVILETLCFFKLARTSASSCLGSTPLGI